MCLVLFLQAGRVPTWGQAVGRSGFPCQQPGWFPDDFGLKDHTVFYHQGLYYLASIYLAADDYENRFAYASSPDLCNWTDLGGILGERAAGGWDEFRIWAPFVYEEGGTYYMFYTGVTAAFAQSIMLATSDDPADPASWVQRGLVLQPDHPGSIWGGFDTWSDCRDPMVVKAGDLYYLYYTGLDNSGGIVGLATASSVLGPWRDWGAVLTRPGSMPESPAVVAYDGLYYLFYNDAPPGGLGEVYRYGPTPAGPWSKARPFGPGWAHEIWLGGDGHFYTSYLTDYTVSIDDLTWDQVYIPARPFVGEAIYRILVPLAFR